LVVVGVRRCDIYNVDVGIFDELFIGTVCLGVCRRTGLLEEVLSARFRRRRGGGYDCVLDRVNSTGGWVDKQVLGTVITESVTAQQLWRGVMAG
jgi:hypothetical protein